MYMHTLPTRHVSSLQNIELHAYLHLVITEECAICKLKYRMHKTSLLAIIIHDCIMCTDILSILTASMQSQQKYFDKNKWYNLLQYNSTSEKAQTKGGWGDILATFFRIVHKIVMVRSLNVELDKVNRSILIR